ncbi:arrestin domain-containing protein 3-like isoform X2 [Toxotes jaculatrix]|uniref:arrestin domain-containing protein 3-like isoform X2 n=1 Tax=Toxotes jaculatrix TaxID=941984 RepID=UPI001B3AF905|nr:arrestin domain-containing protein 3-like isoform X2 [Toxotes jaculatrix]
MFQQTFKNFNINYNSLNENNTFSSGDQITGHISFDLTKQTKITSIAMTLTGKASVHWSSGGHGGGRRRRSRRRHFSAKLEFFNLRNVLIQEQSVTGRAAMLQPGTHVYPFMCQLPQGNFPSTFHGVHGKIEYTLTVGISRPWHLSKDFVTELTFVKHIDTNQPDLRAPLSGTNQTTLCCLWCASQPITVTASVEKKAFVPATLKVRLQQKQAFYTHNKVNRRVVMKNLASVSRQPISAHASDVHTEIMLTIPPTASHTISNCSILVVDYLIEVTLSSCAFPDLTVLCPIILCDTPVHSQPPAYL